MYLLGKNGLDAQALSWLAEVILHRRHLKQICIFHPQIIIKLIN